MSPARSICPDIEMDLVASATGDAEPGTHERIQRHLARCAPCHDEYQRYRALEHATALLREEAPPPDVIGRARKRLEARLHELRRRTVLYRIFPSPLGQVLIALSEQGAVFAVEYLGTRADIRASRLTRRTDLELMEDGAEIETRFRELMEYLDGKRTHLDWPLDLRLVRSEFHRAVLEATARIPYGAVTSYAGLACAVGRPSAARAVAQALRWNPLPIVIPCHRVVGSSGALTGYAGNRIGLKARLLGTEGVPTVRAGRVPQVPRGRMYVGYPESEEYCLPTCSWLERVEHPHRLILFGNRQRAEAAGRRPCADCRPDLHPLAS